MKKILEFCFKMNVIQLKEFFSVCDNGVKVRFKSRYFAQPRPIIVNYYFYYYYYNYYNCLGGGEGGGGGGGGGGRGVT